MSETPICAFCRSDESQYCSCGWESRQLLRAREREQDRVTSIRIGCSALVVSLVLGLLGSWGGEIVAISHLRLYQITGTMSPTQYEELSQLCLRLQKWKCFENSEVERFKLSKDPTILREAGRLTSKVGEREAAAKVYELYFYSGGDDRDAMIEYARILSDLGSKELAEAYYKASIAATPKGTIPARAMIGLVHVLIQQRRYQEAYQKIISFHASAENAKPYLQSELDWIKRQLKITDRVARR